MLLIIKCFTLLSLWLHQTIDLFMAFFNDLSMIHSPNRNNELIPELHYSANFLML